MASVEKHLPPGEEVIFRTRRTVSMAVLPIALFLLYLAATISLGVGGWVDVGEPPHVPLVLILIFVAIGLFVFAFSLSFFLMYYLSEFVLTRKGIFIQALDGWKLVRQSFLHQAISIVRTERDRLEGGWEKIRLVIGLKDGTRHSYKWGARGEEFARLAFAEARQRQAETGGEVAAIPHRRGFTRLQRIVIGAIGSLVALLSYWLLTRS